MSKTPKKSKAETLYDSTASKKMRLARQVGAKPEIITPPAKKLVKREAPILAKGGPAASPAGRIRCVRSGRIDPRGAVRRPEGQCGGKGF